MAAARFAAAVTPAAEDKPAKELEPFQGLWAVASITRSGEAVPGDDIKKLRLVVSGNERQIMDGDEVVSKATFALDATKKPPHMDVTVTDDPLAGKTYRGIHELKDDTLTLWLTLEGDARPDDLTSKEGSKRLLQVFKKSKGDKK